MAQEAEHILGKDEVTSSNLVSSFKNTRSLKRVDGCFVLSEWISVYIYNINFQDSFGVGHKRK